MTVYQAVLRDPPRTPWLGRPPWRDLAACACFGIRLLTSFPARRRTTTGAAA